MTSSQYNVTGSSGIKMNDSTVISVHHLDDLALEMANLTDLRHTLDILTDNLSSFYFCTYAMISLVMLAGFALVSVGQVRTKNTTNLLLKCTLDGFVGSIMYWFFGYAFAWGEGNSFIGGSNFVYAYIDASHIGNAFYHITYANMASLIVSGAVAERLNFACYFIYATILTGFSYPIASRWGWNKIGWLKTMGYYDYGGSGAVFLFAGTCSIVGASFVGPRKGRFDSNRNIKGHSNPIPGHSITVFAVGFYLMIFGFLGLNAGALMSINKPGDGPVMSYAALNTLLACSAGALTSLFANRFLPFWGNYWSYITMCNGATCAMIAVCAGCNNMPAWAAVLTGVVAALVYIGLRGVCELVKLDDPMQAMAIHFGGGLTGLVTCPFLIYDGIFFKQDQHSAIVLGVNILGAVAIIGWALTSTIPIFMIAKKFDILRISEEMEKSGMDIPIHDEQAYPPSAWMEPNLVNTRPQIIPVPSTEAHSDTIIQEQPSMTGPQKNFGQRRRPAPRLQKTTLSSMNLISENSSGIATEPLP